MLWYVAKLHTIYSQSSTCCSVLREFFAPLNASQRFFGDLQGTWCQLENMDTIYGHFSTYRNRMAVPWARQP